jgi:ethanolamine utilization protein EutN
MKLGKVIGNVTLSEQDPAYQGGRFLVVHPMSREQIGGAEDAPMIKANTLVVYDDLGAGIGHIIGYVEGAEATAPFPQPTPVDAINAAIMDDIFYNPPSV